MTKKQYMDKAYGTMLGLLEVYRENFPDEALDSFGMTLYSGFESFPDMTLFTIRGSNDNSDRLDCSLELVECGGEREYKSHGEVF